MKQNFDEIINFFGSKSKLAKLLHVTTPAVSLYVTQGFFPPLQAIKIEKLSYGKFKSVDLVNQELV